MTPRVVLSTRNAHKLGEVQEILGAAMPGALEVVGVDDPAVLALTGGAGVPEVVEDEVTFAGNALLKAGAVAQATGLPAIADDSGIAVDVLGGAPGIFSARWAGRHGDDAANLALLLAQLADVPERHRGAEFVCAAVLVVPGSPDVVEHGRLRGVVEREPRGTGGFGYDPVLRPQGLDVTCAELSPAEKHAISHRGRAFRALAPAVAAALGAGAGAREGAADGGAR